MAHSFTSPQKNASTMIAFHSREDGVLNIRKPEGWTSHDVIMYLRRVLAMQKIGHAGTLDPAATGVLPVLIGRGTKIAQYLLEWDKEYAAVLRLGQRTDTQDASGMNIGETSTESLSEAQIRSVIAEFQGTIQQLPPMFSAVKVGGRPLYKAARKGKTVERSLRSVTVYNLDILAIQGQDVHLRVVCSKGTYIRTLCADIGDRLGVGGHLQSLERTRVGPLHIDDALHPKELEENLGVCSNIGRSFLNLDDALHRFPTVIVNEHDAVRVIHGSPVEWSSVKGVSEHPSHPISDGLPIRLKDRLGNLLALGQVQSSRSTTTASSSLLSIVKVFWPN